MTFSSHHPGQVIQAVRRPTHRRMEVWRRSSRNSLGRRGIVLYVIITLANLPYDLRLLSGFAVHWRAFLLKRGLDARKVFGLWLGQVSNSEIRKVIVIETYQHVTAARHSPSDDIPASIGILVSWNRDA